MGQPYETYTHEQVHKLALSFQDGDSEAGVELAAAFNGFLLKYVNLVSKGSFKMQDRALREFISLYVKNPEIRKNKHQYAKSKAVRDQLRLTAEKIQYLYSDVPKEELMQYALIGLFTLAKRYNPKNNMPSFHMYADRAFHFHFHNEISVQINDPAAMHHTVSFDEHEHLMIDDESAVLFEKALRRAEHQSKVKKMNTLCVQADQDPFDISSLDLNWINGATCGYEFNKLSPFERNIIKMYYVNNMTDEKIANHFGMVRETITRKRNAAKKKIVK